LVAAIVRDQRVAEVAALRDRLRIDDQPADAGVRMADLDAALEAA